MVDEEASRDAGAPDGSPVATYASADGDSKPPKKNNKRSFLTQNACNRCRAKKSKCDGKRPTCERCLKHSADCSYDVPHEGLTRMQNLQQQLHNAIEGRDTLKELFGALQQGADEQAATLLARIRLGETPEDIVASMGGPRRKSSNNTISMLQSPEDWLHDQTNDRSWIPWDVRCQEGIQIDPRFTDGSHAGQSSTLAAMVRSSDLASSEDRYHTQQLPRSADVHMWEHQRSSWDGPQRHP